jgi:site-specific DNA-methyltransferase (adenine-specific)
LADIDTARTDPSIEYSSERGVLFRSDCLALLPLIKDEVVQTVFADPPFNLGKEYGNGFSSKADSRKPTDYVAWSEKWLKECARVLAPGGSIFVYTLPKWGFHHAGFLEGLGLQFRHWIAVSMKSTLPRGKRLYPAHYALLYFSKGVPSTFNKLYTPVTTCRHCQREIKDYGGYRKHLNPAGLNLSDFWEDTSPNRHEKSKARPGVNELNPMIPRRAIEISTKAGDVVLDPFGGGGTTYQEAEHLKRSWIGIEIGDCAPIKSRMAKCCGETPGAPAELADLFSVDLSTFHRAQ